MHNAELYPEDATAPNAKAVSVPAPNNSIDGLLPNHFNIINSEWLTNFVTWKFSGNQARILHAIYRHTTGFRKREDDMNGSRLEQITGIRYDHANEIVRKLAAKNILILRKGFYGFWMSINFNFSQWNQPDVEVSPNSNDPKQLLPDSIRNTPDDAGKSINDDAPQTSCNHQYTHPSETDTVENTAAKTSANHPDESTENIPVQAKTSSQTQTVETQTQITAADLAKIEQNNKALIKQHIGISTDEILDAQKTLSAEMLNIFQKEINDLRNKLEDSEQVNQEISNLNQQIKGLSGLDEKIQHLEDSLDKQLQINQQHKIKNTDLENLVKQQFNQLKQQQNDKSANQAELKNLIQQHLNKTEVQDLIQQQITQNQTTQTQSQIEQTEFNTDLASYSDTCDSEDDSHDSSEALADYHDYLEQEYLQEDTESKEIPETENSDLSTRYTEESETEQPVLNTEITYKLYFPDQFTPDMQTNIKSICAKKNLDQSTATLLLDYMVKKWQRDPREVYNPVGYFSELAMNINNGKQDIEAIKAQLSPTFSPKLPRKMYAPIAPKRDLSLYYIRLKELKKDYQHTKDLHTYYEGHFAKIAKEDNITFEQVVKSSERQEKWNNCVNNLNLAHKAITDYVKESPI